MQRLTNTSLNGALSGITPGSTRVSRLYSRFNPLNPESTKPAFRISRKKKPSLSNNTKKLKPARNLGKNTLKRSESPSDNIRIIIQSVDLTPDTKFPTNMAFLTAANISTNNSSVESSTPRQSQKVRDREAKKKGTRLSKRRMNKPARFLSPNDYKTMTRNTERNRATISETFDLYRKMEEKDKENFSSELVYSKYRKHKYTKLLPVRFDESWEWSSHGSTSPQHRVRFLDL